MERFWYRRHMVVGVGRIFHWCSAIGSTFSYVFAEMSRVSTRFQYYHCYYYFFWCRMNLFSNSDHCSMHTRDLRSLKNVDSRDCNTLANGSSKLIHPMNTSFYTPTPNLPDNRMVWAAITPRGTEHFISENYSR